MIHMANSLCSFDSLNEFFLSISNDNRIRIWETSSGILKHQYVEKGHLSTKYTCFDWYRPTTKISRKRTSSGSRGGLGKLAVGTSTGTITIWDLQRGVVITRLGTDSENIGEGSLISSVSFSSDGSNVFSSSREKFICEWNLETGELVRKMKGLKHGASIISLHPSGSSIAVAGIGIKMIDIKSGKRIRKFKAGHANKITCLAFSSDGRYLVAAATASRLVNIFLCSDKSASEPWAVTLADVPTRLAVQPSTRHQEVLDVAASSVAGALMVVRLEYPSGKASARLQVQNAVGKTPCGAVLAAFPSRNTQELLLCHGQELMPIFERVDFTDSEGCLCTPPPSLALSPEKAGDDASLKGKKKAKASKEDIPEFTEGQAIAMGDLGVKGAEMDSVAEEAKIAKKKGKKKAAPTPTIAERLQSLTAALEASDTDEDGDAKRKRSKAVHQKRAPPTAESLITVLEQALQSSDEALLEHCLSNHDPVVVNGTVARLPAPKVVVLLNKLVAKFEKRPARVELVATWVRALLTTHAGFLASVPGLAVKLAKLYQVIDHRLSVYPKLLALSGRLELLMSQLPPPQATAKADEEELKKVPLVVFKGGTNDSSDSGSEKEKAEGAQDGEEGNSSEGESGEEPSDSPKMNGVVGDNSEESGDEENSQDSDDKEEESS